MAFLRAPDGFISRAEQVMLKEPPFKEFFIIILK